MKERHKQIYLAFIVYLIFQGSVSFGRESPNFAGLVAQCNDKTLLSRLNISFDECVILARARNRCSLAADDRKLHGEARSAFRKSCMGDPTIRPRDE